MPKLYQLFQLVNFLISARKKIKEIKGSGSLIFFEDVRF